ncbi:MAG TPA: 4-(cytidine 5'-diphospho)-2-C-methyl-D-erythritol kinase [Caulobacteraceae bacterium]
MIAERLAPAKVNLFLHVGPVQPDGYHPLASWAAFADIGDRLTLEPAARWSFETTGRFGEEIAGENLVERALRALFERLEAAPPPMKLTLEKTLPVAAGLGGGTSDATAALRLVNAALSDRAAEAVLEEIAAGLGADGPVCLTGVATIMQGRGERLSPAPSTPPLPVVLLNPGAPAPTGAVYRAYDGAGVPGGADLPALPQALESVEAVVAALGPCRNDLETPAISVAPAVAEALALARSAPETLLARMSGSGATVFVLCANDVGARSLALRLSGARPSWWVAAGRLSG